MRATCDICKGRGWLGVQAGVCGVCDGEGEIAFDLAPEPVSAAPAGVHPTDVAEYFGCPDTATEADQHGMFSPDWEDWERQRHELAHSAHRIS